VSDKSAVIIGAGVGGLSCACYLAQEGMQVTVVEKNEQIGGRASVLEKGGFKFDMGPSWYLMPDVFERFFEFFDRKPEDYYEIIRLDPHYRIFFKDQKTVDIVADVEQNKLVFEQIEKGAGEALGRYLDNSKRTYELGMQNFVYKDRPRLRDYISLDVLLNANKISLFGSMQKHVNKYFLDSKLQQIMQYTLVFLGGSPKNTPALYNLMSHVDFNLGVYYPEGGIGKVISSISELGKELGVTYKLGFEVDSIENENGLFSVKSKTGGEIKSDVVISNADYNHTEQVLLPIEKRQFDEKYWESRTYAPSAFLIYLGVEGDIDPLIHHNLVLPTDWDGHFEEIFTKPTWPTDPAYYICAPSDTDDSVAPEGCSNLFILVPIAVGIKDGKKMRKEYRDKILADVAENVGVDIRNRIILEEHFSISDFSRRYNSAKGSALGLAHTLIQTGPIRPDNRSKKMKGMYFTGGYTRPGIGVPMCLISGEHTAKAVIEDLER
jgi:phytoene desaturase